MKTWDQLSLGLTQIWKTDELALAQESKDVQKIDFVVQTAVSFFNAVKSSDFFSVPECFLLTTAEIGQKWGTQGIKISWIDTLSWLEPVKELAVRWVILRLTLIWVGHLVGVCVEILSERFLEAELLVAADQKVDESVKERVDATKEC